MFDQENRQKQSRVGAVAHQFKDRPETEARRWGNSLERGEKPKPN
jgi:hypothetical protein